ncbi:aromatic amino acid transporter [Pseudomonas sp. F1_0610]|uniref:aromatic amino acid transporter n=1 Tax=Pseudomonas sp. F1_0610 TaxID=3114284 RepID=UPI0039C4CD8A
MPNTATAPHKHPSLLGGAMIIAGTAIGAGMLANPTATSGVWFLGSLVLMLYVWFSMFTSGLMILEANLNYEAGASFHTIVNDLLGKHWNIITGLAVAFTLYMLTYAYIFVGGNATAAGLEKLLSSVTGTPTKVYEVLGSSVFLLVLGFLVWLSTKTVDRISTVLIGGMIISFFLSTGSLLSHASLPILLDSHTSSGQSYWQYIWVALPVCVSSFGFHGNVPSLVNYYNRNTAKIVKCIFLGSFLSLVIYILWQFAVQGNLPRNNFAPVIAADGDVKVLLGALSAYISTKGVSTLLDAFAYMAISSSFLGVTLGLFDYIADMFKFANTAGGRFKAALITFLPPYIAFIVAPTGFVNAMGYVGAVAAIWAALVPALLVIASRKKYPKANYRVYGGNFMVGFVMVFAALAFFSQVFAMLKWLPKYAGL